MKKHRTSVNHTSAPEYTLNVPFFDPQLWRNSVLQFLSTKDVIHNFKLPELRVSQDAISGMQIPVWFEATMTSEEFLEQSVGTGREGKGFQIACAQLCGLGHSKMVGYMTVHDDEGYANWLEEQKEYLLEEDEDDWGDDEW